MTDLIQAAVDLLKESKGDQNLFEISTNQSYLLKSIKSFDNARKQNDLNTMRKRDHGSQLALRKFNTPVSHLLSRTLRRSVDIKHANDFSNFVKKKLTKEEQEFIDDLNEGPGGTPAKRYEKHKNHWLVQSIDKHGEVEDHEMFLPHEKHKATELQKDLIKDGHKSVKVVNPSKESFYEGKLVVKEETQIDELKKSTLGDYLKKAGMDQQGRTASHAITGYQGKDLDKGSSHKWKKRHQGINRAVDKLTKEEQEFIDDLNSKINEVESLNSIAKKAAKEAHKNNYDKEQAFDHIFKKVIEQKKAHNLHPKDDDFFYTHDAYDRGRDHFQKLRGGKGLWEQEFIDDLNSKKIDEEFPFKMKEGLRSSSLLPSKSRIHPDHPHKNEYHADWQKSGTKGTYLLAAKTSGYPEKTTHIVISGHGSPDNYPNVGDKIRAHHDQTRANFGHLTIIHKTTHDDVNSIPIKKSHPLYVYK